PWCDADQKAPAFLPSYQFESSGFTVKKNQNCVQRVPSDRPCALSGTPRRPDLLMLHCTPEPIHNDVVAPCALLAFRLKRIICSDGQIPSGISKASMTISFDCHFAQRT